MPFCVTIKNRAQPYRYTEVIIMAEKLTRWQKFRRFLKRSITPKVLLQTAYHVAFFIISIALLVGVASYAITKSYEEVELSFVEGFTITAHTGAFDTDENSLASVEAAIANKVDILEIDIRQRPNGTLVMDHELVITNNDGVPLSEAFELLKDSDIRINLDIKETRVLNALHDMLVEYGLYSRAFLTGIESKDVAAVKASSCADMEYYLNCQPSRMEIFSEDYQQKLIGQLKETGAIGVNCHYSYAGGQLCDLLHANGYKLSVWTVNEKSAMKRALNFKPDNITTKQYDLLKSVIEDWDK